MGIRTHYSMLVLRSGADPAAQGSCAEPVGAVQRVESQPMNSFADPTAQALNLCVFGCAPTGCNGTSEKHGPEGRRCAALRMDGLDAALYETKNVRGGGLAHSRSRHRASGWRHANHGRPSELRVGESHWLLRGSRRAHPPRQAHRARDPCPCHRPASCSRALSSSSCTSSSKSLPLSSSKSLSSLPPNTSSSVSSDLSSFSSLSSSRSLRSCSLSSSLVGFR